MRCLYCGKTYEKLSEEHIIPNVLYGHLKSKTIMCRDCNTSFSDIDVIFESSYKSLLTFINTKKDRKKSIKSIPVKVNGIEASYDELGGLGAIAKPIINNGQLCASIVFNEHTKDEVLQESKKRLLGALRKQSQMPESEMNRLIDQALGASLPLNEVLYFPTRFL